MNVCINEVSSGGYVDEVRLIKEVGSEAEAETKSIIINEILISI